MEPSKEPTFALLSGQDFVPENYVKSLSQSYVGGSELQNLRKKIQNFSEETSNNLKKNVYQNYIQFIDTAKEISHLESEMYQLSHLLSEQKSLLSALSTTSILEDRSHMNNIEKEKQNNEKDKDEDNRQKIATILEKVEGCKELLEVPGRVFLFEGDLLEIDPSENTALKLVHVYLFTDGFMITNRNPNSKGLMKYVFEVLYELGSLAVVNVRDLGNIKHAFKLLIFPDTRVFQCSSNANKKEWLDKFDQAKKTRLAQEQQKRESVLEKSPSRSASIDSRTPFALEAEEEQLTIHPEWFVDVSDELDVCMAQRHFEEAVNILQKSKEYITNHNQKQDHIIIDIQRKLEAKQNNLIEMLMKELEVNPDKSLQGGLRAARRAVRLLNQLNRATQSCNLFLKLCSSMLKAQYKRVKREGSTTTYIRNLASVVFTNICHMSEEFLRAFPETSGCASAYVVWISTELNNFMVHFAKHVFMPQTSLSAITECVELVRTQCERLFVFGVDFCYQLDGALRTPLTKALRDTRDKLIDSIKVRSLEDKWIPMSLGTRSAITRCIQEHLAMGIDLEPYVTGDIWLQLTPSTLAFTKLFLTLLNDCLRLKTADLLHTIDETLSHVFEAQIKYIEQALRMELNTDQRQFMVKNAEFLLDKLLKIAQQKYKEFVGYECGSLNKIPVEYSAVVKGVSPAVRNVKTKYSSEFV